MNVCSAYSPLLSTHVCADYTRRSRAESHLHLLFYTSRRPRCFAAVCWFLLRGCVFRPDDACQKRFSWFPDWIQQVQKYALGCVFRPDDACQKRFSWFPDWIQTVQTCVNLVDLVKSFQTRIYYSLEKFGVDTAENGPLKVCRKFAKS